MILTGMCAINRDINRNVWHKPWYKSWGEGRGGGGGGEVGVEGEGGGGGAVVYSLFADNVGFQDVDNLLFLGLLYWISETFAAPVRQKTVIAIDS